MSSRLSRARPHKPAGRFKTKKRVIEGLRAAALTIWQNDEKLLPTSTESYQKAIIEYEPVKSGHQRRLYPGPSAVLNHFASMNHAWTVLGFEIETSFSHYSVSKEIHDKLEYIYSFKDVPASERPADLPTVRAYAKEIGLEGRHHVLSQYAAKQGWVKPKEPNWSRAELKLLEKYAHLSPYRIQKYMHDAGFSRTVISVRLMRKRRLAHKGAPYYSSNALAKLLGVDPHKIDREWLIKYPKELTFEMKGTGRLTGPQGGDTKLFHIDTVREFFCNHPEEVDLGRVDKVWFLWLITNGKVKMVAPSDRVSIRSEGFRPGAAKEHRKTAPKETEVRVGN